MAFQLRFSPLFEGMTHAAKSNMEKWNNLDNWVWCFVVVLLCQSSVSHK